MMDVVELVARIPEAQTMGVIEAVVRRLEGQMMAAVRKFGAQMRAAVHKFGTQAMTPLPKSREQMTYRHHPRKIPCEPVVHGSLEWKIVGTITAQTSPDLILELMNYSQNPNLTNQRIFQRSTGGRPQIAPMKTPEMMPHRNFPK